MRLGLDRKPDIKYVKKNVEELMKACPDVPILITQSRLCKNANDEVDLFPHKYEMSIMPLLSGLYSMRMKL